MKIIINKNKFILFFIAFFAISTTDILCAAKPSPKPAKHVDYAREALVINFKEKCGKIEELITQLTIKNKELRLKEYSQKLNDLSANFKKLIMNAGKHPLSDKKIYDYLNVRDTVTKNANKKSAQDLLTSLEKLDKEISTNIEESLKRENTRIKMATPPAGAAKEPSQHDKATEGADETEEESVSEAEEEESVSEDPELRTLKIEEIFSKIINFDNFIKKLDRFKALTKEFSLNAFSEKEIDPILKKINTILVNHNIAKIVPSSKIKILPTINAIIKDHNGIIGKDLRTIQELQETIKGIINKTNKLKKEKSEEKEETHEKLEALSLTENIFRDGDSIALIINTNANISNAIKSRLKEEEDSAKNFLINEITSLLKISPDSKKSIHTIILHAITLIKYFNHHIITLRQFLGQEKFKELAPLEELTQNFSKDFLQLLNKYDATTFKNVATERITTIKNKFNILIKKVFSAVDAYNEYTKKELKINFLYETLDVQTELIENGESYEFDSEILDYFIMTLDEELTKKIKEKLTLPLDEANIQKINSEITTLFEKLRIKEYIKENPLFTKVFTLESSSFKFEQNIKNWGKLLTNPKKASLVNGLFTDYFTEPKDGSYPDHFTRYRIFGEEQVANGEDTKLRYESYQTIDSIILMHNIPEILLRKILKHIEPTRANLAQDKHTTYGEIEIIDADNQTLLKTIPCQFSILYVRPQIVGNPLIINHTSAKKQTISEITDKKHFTKYTDKKFNNFNNVSSNQNIRISYDEKTNMCIFEEMVQYKALRRNIRRIFKVYLTPPPTAS